VLAATTCLPRAPARSVRSVHRRARRHAPRHRRRRRPPPDLAGGVGRVLRRRLPRAVDLRCAGADRRCRPKQRERLVGASRIAPGCNASTVALSLVPGVAAGVIDARDIVSVLAVGPSGRARA
jgi:hypothetical protein